MRVLQLSNKVPFPPLDGGSIVIHNASKGLLAEGCEVHLLAVDTPKRPIAVEDLPQDYRDSVHLQTAKLDTRITILGAFFNLFSRLPYHVSRYRSADFSEKLIRLLRLHDFDVVQIESLYMMIYVPLIRQHSRAKIVLRAQNVEHQIWEKYACNLSFSLKKIYLGWQAARLKNFEKTSCAAADGIIAITENDRVVLEKMAAGKPVISIPLGVELEKFPLADPTAAFFEKTIFHLGSMDWYPNLEAVEWLLDEIWPLVHAKMPNLKLCIAGKHMPPRFHNYQKFNVLVENQIDDPVGYMLEKTAMIVPLRSGSGIRVKILEGMAMGKPIIATSVAAEGIECSNGRDILIADSPEDLAETICCFFQQPEKFQNLGKNARHLIETRYDQRVLARRFVEFYQKMVE